MAVMVVKPIRKKTTCRLPGHGTYCEPARERDRFYCRTTEERMALAFESSADDLAVRGVFVKEKT